MIEKYLNQRVKIVYNDLTKDEKYKAIFGLLTQYDKDFLKIKQDNGIDVVLNVKQIVLIKENEK